MSDLSEQIADLEQELGLENTEHVEEIAQNVAHLMD